MAGGRPDASKERARMPRGRGRIDRKRGQDGRSGEVGWQNEKGPGGVKWAGAQKSCV